MSKTARVMLLLVWLWLACVKAQTAQAASISAESVLAAVNDLRASQGLATYQAAGWLASYAQRHSEYQASINTSTHTHSDGSLPWQIGLQENIAAGDSGLLSTDFIINQIWADAIHMNTMIGYASGYAGVGIAADDGTTYVTLDVRPAGAAVVNAPRQVAGVQAASEPSSTPRPFVPIVTSTPQPDGKIVHVVASGDSLWSIAVSYGVTMDEIRGLNSMAAGSTSIRIGQKLVIRVAIATVIVQATGTLAATASPTFTTTSTRLPPTQTRTVAPSATVTLTPLPSATPTSTPPAAARIDRRTVGITLVVVCVLGLLVVGLTGFRKR